MSSKPNHDIQDRTGFFVEPDECVTCGCCQREAPNNFSWAEDNVPEGFDQKRAYGSCVHKQPDSKEELDAVIDAFKVCITDCIYYGGSDRKIIKRLIDEDVPDCSIIRLGELNSEN